MSQSFLLALIFNKNLNKKMWGKLKVFVNIHLQVTPLHSLCTVYACADACLSLYYFPFVNFFGREKSFPGTSAPQ